MGGAQEDYFDFGGGDLDVRHISMCVLMNLFGVCRRGSALELVGLD